MKTVIEGGPLTRRDIERVIVIKTVDAMLAAGYALAVLDDENEEQRPATPTTDRAAILAEMMVMDDEFLGVFQTGGDVAFAWVRFVYGNDGWDVIADYTTNLEAKLAPVNEYAGGLA